jgi:tRNA A37 methylthiotransferase MiaB
MDDVPAAEKRRRLNVLLGLQEGIGRERNDAWLGRRTEVLVEEARPRRAHDHAADDTSAAAGLARLVGRNREHRILHLDGPESLIGGLVEVIVDRAGPYALSGHAAEEGHHA